MSILPLFSLSALAQVADERGNEEVDAATAGVCLDTNHLMADFAALPDVEILESLAPSLAAQSNLDSERTVPVGSTPGLSAAGAADMFGNVVMGPTTGLEHKHFEEAMEKLESP